MAENLVIFGAIALDNISTEFGRVERVLGGSGSYSSFSASFFEKPALLGAIGEDFPQQYLELLSNHNVETKFIQRVSGKNFFWEGEYEKDINIRHTKKLELNSLQKFQPKVPDELKAAEFVCLGPTLPEHQLKLLEQFENPKFVLADTIDFYINTAREKLLELIDSVDICLMNEYEVKLLYNESNLIKAGKNLLNGRSPVTIIKKGEHGSLMISKNSFFSAPAFPLEKVVDPTGAGDCFAGALIGFLAREKKTDEKTLRKAMIYGSAIASLNCEGFSLNMLRNVNMKEIEERVKHFKKFVEF